MNDLINVQPKEELDYSSFEEYISSEYIDGEIKINDLEIDYAGPCMGQICVTRQTYCTYCKACIGDDL